MGKAGHLYVVGHGQTGMIGTFKIEMEVVSGSGKFERAGLGSNRETKESIDTAYNYFRANKKNISGSISSKNSDYLMHVQDLQGIGVTTELSLAAFIAMCSGALKKPVQSQMVILGTMSIGGTITKVEQLANTLQVCLDAGAKKILIPMASAVDIATVPPGLFAKFQISFYQDPEDAVFKALGVE